MIRIDTTDQQRASAMIHDARFYLPILLELLRESQQAVRSWQEVIRTGTDSETRRFFEYTVYKSPMDRRAPEGLIWEVTVRPDLATLGVEAPEGIVVGWPWPTVPAEMHDLIAYLKRLPPPSAGGAR